MFLTFGLFKTFMYNQNIDKVKEIFLEWFYVKKSQVAKYIRVKYFAKINVLRKELICYLELCYLMTLN